MIRSTHVAWRSVFATCLTGRQHSEKSLEWCDREAGVAVLELSEPRSGWMGPMARWHMHHVVPAIGGLLSGSREYRYLQKSIAAFPPSEEFAELMTEAGLEVCEVESLTFGVCTLYVARVPEVVHDA